MAVMVADSGVEYQKKLFYKINEVGRITGLKPYVLRYWESEFPQLAPEKDENDQRRYRQEDIELVLKIKKLLYEEKFTIAGAKQRIGAEQAENRERNRHGAKPASESSAPAQTMRAPVMPAVRGGASAVQPAAAAPRPIEVRPSAPLAQGAAQARPALRRTPARAGWMAELNAIRGELVDLVAFLK